MSVALCQYTISFQFFWMLLIESKLQKSLILSIYRRAHGRRQKFINRYALPAELRCQESPVAEKISIEIFIPTFLPQMEAFSESSNISINLGF